MADGSHRLEVVEDVSDTPTLIVDKGSLEDPWFKSEKETLEEARARVGMVEDPLDPYEALKVEAKKTRREVAETLKPAFSEMEKDWFKEEDESTKEARTRFEKKHGHKIEVNPDEEEDSDARVAA